MLTMQDTAFGRVRRGVSISKALLIATALASVSGPVLAQSNAQPEDEYKKLIQVSQDIQPLGDNPFGERIGLYDGSLSFRQVDVTVTGTGPTITVGREFLLHSMDDRPDLQDRAFGDWDIELPLITTTTANQNNVQGWLVASTNPKTICNPSKGAGDYPKSPPPDYEGEWPPPHWSE